MAFGSGCQGCTAGVPTVFRVQLVDVRGHVRGFTGALRLRVHAHRCARLTGPARVSLQADRR